MSAAAPDRIEIDNAQDITDAADCWADEYGTAEAIQRLWIALGHLKRRQAREDNR